MELRRTELEFRESKYVAFNFFLTAEHLVDWVHPDGSKQGDNPSARGGKLRLDPLLATTKLSG